MREVKRVTNLENCLFLSLLALAIWELIFKGYFLTNVPQESLLIVLWGTGVLVCVIILGSLIGLAGYYLFFVLYSALNNLIETYKPNKKFCNWYVLLGFVISLIISALTVIYYSFSPEDYRLTYYILGSISFIVTITYQLRRFIK